MLCIVYIHVMSSIYRTRSYIPTLQWGLVNGTIAGKTRNIAFGVLTLRLRALRFYCPPVQGAPTRVFRDRNHPSHVPFFSIKGFGYHYYQAGTTLFGQS